MTLRYPLSVIIFQDYVAISTNRQSSKISKSLTTMLEASAWKLYFSESNSTSEAQPEEFLVHPMHSLSSRIDILTLKS